MYVELLIEEMENKQDEMKATKRFAKWLGQPITKVKNALKGLGEKIANSKAVTKLKETKIVKWVLEKIGKVKQSTLFQKIKDFYMKIKEAIANNKLSLGAAAAVLLSVIANIAYAMNKGIQDKPYTKEFFRKLIEAIKNEEDKAKKLGLLAINVLGGLGLLAIFGKAVKALVNKMKTMFKKEEQAAAAAK